MIEVVLCLTCNLVRHMPLFRCSFRPQAGLLPLLDVRLNQVSAAERNPIGLPTWSLSPSVRIIYGKPLRNHARVACSHPPDKWSYEQQNKYLKL